MIYCENCWKNYWEEELSKPFYNITLEMLERFL